MTLIVM